MQNPIKRLFSPILLQVDFTQAYWALSARQARCWLGAAVASDLLVQALVGLPDVFTILASFGTLVLFWAAPARLSGAVGGLYITQALVSAPLVVSVGHFTGRSTAEVAGVTWSCWCFFALLFLILRYIRTPKKDMRTA